MPDKTKGYAFLYVHLTYQLVQFYLASMQWEEIQIWNENKSWVVSTVSQKAMHLFWFMSAVTNSISFFKEQKSDIQHI